MVSLALQLGNLMAKAGLTTRKSSMRFAESAGKAMVDHFKTLEHNPEQADIVEVLEKILPKNIQPTIITDFKEVIKCQAKNFKITEEEVASMINEASFAGGCITDGVKRGPIYLSIKELGKEPASIVAHELEHNLEFCSLKQRIGRLFQSLRKIFITKTSKETSVNIAAEWREFEQYLLCIPLRQHLDREVSALFEISPTKENIYELLKHSPETLSSDLRKLLREYADCETKGKFTRVKYSTFATMVDAELPAYTVGGRVHQYAAGEGKTSCQTMRALLYEDMAKVIKKDRKQYRRNKLRGELKRGYRSDADILALAKNEEEIKFLNNLLPKCDEQTKRQLFAYIRLKPAYLESMIRNLKDSNFKTIVQLKNAEGARAFDNTAKEILLQTSPERLKEFAEIASQKTADGLYKYQTAVYAINHPRFDLIKKIADIEVNGKNPYAEISGELCMCSAEELEHIYTTLKSEGLNNEILQIINDRLLSATKTDKLRIMFNI